MANNDLAKDDLPESDLQNVVKPGGEPPQALETRARYFRRAMAQWPAGVTVAAADDGAACHGLTVSSFTSVSLNPPLCLICLRNETPLLPILRRAGRFAVHVLAEDQQDVAALFAAGPASQRLARLLRHPGAPPRLERFLVRFSFTLYDQRAAGDHEIVVGAVERIETAQGDVADLQDGAFGELPAPLTWWGSRMGSLAPDAKD